MYKRLILLIALLSSFINFSQTKLLHEIGVITGPVSMQTDFGERHHFPSSVLNIGYGIGVVYYLSFDENNARWNQRGSYLQNYLKLRFEVSYMKNKLIQRGRYIEGNSNQALLLKGIIGDSKLFNVGGQVEFSIFSAMDNRHLKPYVSIGGMYTSYNPTIESIYGDIETDPSLIPTAYIGGIHNKSGATGSLIIGAGTRYVTDSNLKFVMDFRWQRFIKDDIEGLTPLISANKYNDWLFFFNVGIVFSLN
jgi:hypothetical protein